MYSRLLLVAVACLLCSLGGCGGGGKKEPSLDAQLKKAHAESDSGRKARLLAGLGEKQLKAGDVIAGDGTLNAALEAASSVEDPASKANSLIYVGQAFGRAGKTTESKKALREAAKSLEAVDDPGSKANAFAELGAASGTLLKNPDQAADYLKSAEAAADKIDVPAIKAGVFGKIYIAYQKNERPTEADATLTKAKAFAKEQASPKDQVECLAEIGDALSKAKKTDDASTFFNDAEKTAGDIKEDDARGYAYLSLARKLKQAGRGEEARQALSKADDAALKIKDGSIRQPLIADIQAAAK
ncbi:hypothetical protein NA78x_002257 [Anatilimnocola sp. NA78]|uniref:hypothetical protein n=1 Tax=Anatilimnocola sp. NA78 TaxID=3415683 RepID=UPI003CE4F025